MFVCYTHLVAKSVAQRDVGPSPVLAVGYIRVSTTDQVDSGGGLAAQRQAIRSEVQRRGWSLLTLCTDEAVSGKSLVGRLALAEALSLVESGQAQVLVVSRLDRLSRSLLDFATLMGQASKQGWNLVALDLGIDLSTPAGEFLASVMAGAAQWERRIIGQRTRDALAAKKAAGVRLGRPQLITDEVLVRMAEMRQTGMTFRAIADRLSEEGIPTAQGGLRWYPATVRAALNSQGGRVNRMGTGRE
jgi:DNA invertase Pin-like site-specific DNA recombinase